MDSEDNFWDDDDNVLHHVDHDMAAGQKLTLENIRQTSPDYIEIVRYSGDLRPERHFSFVVTKGDTSVYYEDKDLDLSAEEMATLKEEFKVKETTLEVTPSPAAMALAEREWEEWEKVNGPRPRFQDSPKQ